MTEFLTKKTRLKGFLCIPRCLLEEQKLSGTELFLYALLLDRAKVSQRSPEWIDKEGRVFLFYTVAELARILGKTEMTVKRSMNKLEQVGLLERKRQGACRANKLYLKIPVQEMQNMQAEEEGEREEAAPCGKAQERAMFDRLIAKKQREQGIISVPRREHLPLGEGTSGGS